MKNKIFEKRRFNVNIIFSFFSANDANIIFSVKPNIIFSTIPDIFQKKSIEQDNYKKIDQRIKYCTKRIGDKGLRQQLSYYFRSSLFQLICSCRYQYAILDGYIQSSSVTYSCKYIQKSVDKFRKLSKIPAIEESSILYSIISSVFLFPINS